MVKTVRLLVGLTCVSLGVAVWLALRPSPRDAFALWKARSGPLNEEFLHVQRGIRFNLQGPEFAVIVRGEPSGQASSRILRKSGLASWDILAADDIDEWIPSLPPRIEDMSGNGRPDILIPTHAGTSGESYDLWHYSDQHG